MRIEEDFVSRYPIYYLNDARKCNRPGSFRHVRRQTPVDPVFVRNHRRNQDLAAHGGGYAFWTTPARRRAFGSGQFVADPGVHGCPYYPSTDVSGAIQLTRDPTPTRLRSARAPNLREEELVSERGVGDSIAISYRGIRYTTENRKAIKRTEI